MRGALMLTAKCTNLERTGIAVVQNFCTSEANIGSEHAFCRHINGLVDKHNCMHNCICSDCTMVS